MFLYREKITLFNGEFLVGRSDALHVLNHLFVPLWKRLETGRDAKGGDKAGSGGGQTIIIERRGGSIRSIRSIALAACRKKSEPSLYLAWSRHGSASAVLHQIEQLIQYFVGAREGSVLHGSEAGGGSLGYCASQFDVVFANIIEVV